MSNRPPRGASGFTLVELLIVVAIVGVIAAIAVPGLLGARLAANEASAIGSLRAINSAEAAYASSAGNIGHAIQLATLAIPCAGSPVGFIAADLAVDPAVKSGYIVALAADADRQAGPNDCNGTPSELGYYATAIPLTVGRTGSRGFATDAGQTIWQSTDGTAPTQPFVGGPLVSALQ